MKEADSATSSFFLCFHPVDVSDANKGLLAIQGYRPLGVVMLCCEVVVVKLTEVHLINVLDYEGRAAS